MQHVQALILLSQLKRFRNDAIMREENAAYLNQELSKIPGIVPHKPVPGAEKAAYHMYPFRFIEKDFGKIDRSTFLKAMRAEGIPVRSGYGRQNHDGLMKEALDSRGFRRLFSDSRLDEWHEQNVLPGNDQLTEEAVTMYQSVLLGSRKDMDDIVNAVTKVYKNRSKLG